MVCHPIFGYVLFQKRWCDSGDMLWINARQITANWKMLLIMVAFHSKAAMLASKVERSPKITVFGQKEVWIEINCYDMRKAQKRFYLRSEHFNFIKHLFQQQIVDWRLKNYILQVNNHFYVAFAIFLSKILRKNRFSWHVFNIMPSDTFLNYQWCMRSATK